jgi:hypothetical protein
MRGPLLVLVLVACTPVEGERVDVTAPTLMSIEVTPSTLVMKPILSPGPKQLEAKAIFSDGSTQNVTADVTWSSADTNAATVSADGKVAIAGAMSPATVLISATLDEVSGTAEVKVVELTLVVASYSAARISFFSAFASGNVEPLRTIEGSATLLSQPRDVAIMNGELFVANSNTDGSINVYPVDGEGDIAPIRRIAGPATGLTGTNANGISVSPTEIYVGTGSTVLVFPIDATGDVPPKRAVGGTPSTIGIIVGVRWANDELYVGPASTAIPVFPASATGSPAPTRRITGAATTLSNAWGVLVDDGELYVTNAGNNTVSVFPANADGDVAPNRTFSGGLSAPQQMAILGDEIYVGSFSNNTVHVYPKDSSGAVTPVRSLTGASTTIAGPFAIGIY